VNGGEASVDVVTRVIIERPRADVAAFAANPDNAPVWYVNIKSVEWRSPPPARVGSRVAFVAHFLFRKLEYVYELVVFDPPSRVVMRTADGPFPMETTYEWRAIDASKTEMTLRNCGAPSGFISLLRPFVAGMMRRANTKDLRRLKSILEPSR
jgi:hypothetical protein